MRFSRDIYPALEATARSFPAVLLTGARQTGKTTLLREVFSGHRYVTLDLPADAALAESDPTAFLSLHPRPLLVDEVQYAPQLFRHLKILLDAQPSQRGQLVLTGSQRFVLMQGVTESLAGRIAIHELDTLSAAEVAPDPERNPWLADISGCCARGFFPAIWNDPEMSAATFYASYVATYLERDVRQLRLIGDLRAFDRFLRLVAARSGQVLNRSDLARDAAIAPRTAEAWLSVLEASDQISLLEPFYENASKRLVRSPKLYMNDVGLMCFLLGLRPEVLAGSPLQGAVFETLVFGELRKLLRAREPRGRLAFFRDRDGREVDFVFIDGHELDLIECKAKEIPDAHDAAGLRRVVAEIERRPHYRLRHRILTCRTQRPFPLGDDTWAVSPWASMWLRPGVGLDIGAHVG